MSRSAGISWRASAAAAAMLLALSACGKHDDALAEKLAAAEAAADKAVTAQHAAEKAAAIAASIRPAPAAESTTTDTGPESDDRDDDDGDHSYRDDDGEFSMGGSPQTVSADGVVIPGQGV